MTVQDGSVHFWKTREYNEVVWLLLMALDEVVKEKIEFRDSDFLVHCHINKLRCSMSALKDSFTSCSYRTTIAENQM